jgi:hypothetical protein
MWVYKYYYFGVNNSSWGWYYPYHYAPLAGEVAALTEKASKACTEYKLFVLGFLFFPRSYICV